MKITTLLSKIIKIKIINLLRLLIGDACKWIYPIDAGMDERLDGQSPGQADAGPTEGICRCVIYYSPYHFTLVTDIVHISFVCILYIGLLNLVE